ncbi:hypothetical protein UNDKW_2540 [Undibacterium sp. KW1]|uniref:hypothetical protein n=1 Tax=Undibacterium sp. KW1 TaxID=2058624 RepID=UPI001331D619|nr:hypothetical protein [Undibacterium sp. KW1]BBB60813.1 hypothetical protein UNDKW_2540 [Undibacterium sp. KW1]
MSPYFDRVWDIIRGDWDDYQNENSERVQALNSPRTRASQIHDFMRDRATRLAELDSTIKAVIRNQITVVMIYVK